MSGILNATELSLWVALLSTLLVVPLALLLASLLHKTRWRFLEIVLLIPLFWSPTVSGFLLLWGLSPNHWWGALLRDAGFQIVFTFWGTVLACAVVSFPLAYQACVIGRRRVPEDTTAGAQVMGGTPMLVTCRIVWPQMRGALAVACLLVAARSLGEFGASMMLGGNLPGESQTLPLAVYTLAESQQLELAGLAALVSALLGGLMYGLMRVVEHRAP